MRKNERVRTDRVFCGEAPDRILVVVAISAPVRRRHGAVFEVGAIDVEVEAKRLAIAEWHQIVYVRVLLFVLIFDVRKIQRRAEIFRKGVSASYEIVLFQTARVAICPAHGTVSGKVTSIDFQSIDLIAGDQTAREGLRQQAGVISCQNRQYNELLSIL